MRASNRQQLLEVARQRERPLTMKGLLYWGGPIIIRRKVLGRSGAHNPDTFSLGSNVGGREPRKKTHQKTTKGREVIQYWTHSK